MKKSPAIIVCTLMAAVSLAPAVSLRAAEDEVATTFMYTGANAAKVEIAGEFSNWKTLPMTKGDGEMWSTTLHLKPGYYGYKVVVNGEWLLDPGNPARKMVNDIESSSVSVGGVQPQPGAATSMSGKVPVTFNFSDATAKSVHVAGEFNNWLDNVDGKVTEHAEWQLQNDGAGNWKTTVPLASGRYKFKYVIDGGDHWEQDRSLPSTPDGNSVVEVKATGEQPSASAPATPAQGGVSATFTYVDTNANAVFVAGEFNKWNATANPLQKDTNGIWTTSITLPPGRYQYKYVADGNWKEDPANTESADDGLGGRNSVKVVGQ